MALDRITASLLAEFSSENGFADLDEAEQFALFTSYIATRRHYGETFDAIDIETGAGGDTGIDAIAVIVNGNLVTDVESVQDLLDTNGYLEATFVFVQSERSPSFDVGKLGKFTFGVQDFFSAKPILKRNQRIADTAEIVNAIYDRSSKFKQARLPSCRLYYMTTGNWRAEGDLEARRKQAQSDLMATGQFNDVEFSIIGQTGIREFYAQLKNAISKTFKFRERVPLPQIEHIKEAYIGYMPADEYLKIVTGDDGEIIDYIFFDNMRAWLEYDAEINGEIRDTLTSAEEAQRFVLKNNGVTIIASNIVSPPNQTTIEDFQIVNGCQTTHVLFDQRDNFDQVKVLIPIRLIVTDNEDIKRSITWGTNRQTKIKSDEFFAHSEFGRMLEQYFQSPQEVDRKLYYEHRLRQYDRKAIERRRIITPTDTVRAYASMFLEEPHRVTRSYRLVKQRLGKDIYGKDHKPDPYYAAAFALYVLESLFKSKAIDRKLRAAKFHIIMAFRYLANAEPVPRPNSKEIEKYSSVLNGVLWDRAYAEKLLVDAAEIVRRMAGDDLSRDNIRTQKFTEDVIAACKAGRDSQ